MAKGASPGSSLGHSVRAACAPVAVRPQKAGSNLQCHSHRIQTDAFEEVDLACLGLSQLVSWGISDYLIGLFGESIASDLRWASNVVYGGSSAAADVDAKQMRRRPSQEARP